jgi:predicted phosphoribosyltransferase
MEKPPPSQVVDLPELRDRLGVFRDRAHAGKILAEMLKGYAVGDALVMAIPAGGVPVASVLAEQLNLHLDVAVVNKITLPWNTEAGYGALAFDGTVRLNNELVARVGLTDEEVRAGIEKTSNKVARRLRDLRGNRAFPDISAHPVIVVDDGLASGFTMCVAVEALRKAGGSHIVVAVPTGHQRSVEKTATQVEIVYCANVRGGWSFAVADAYEQWADVEEEEVLAILAASLWSSSG